MYGILFRVEVDPAERLTFIGFIHWDAQVAREREPGTLRFECYEDPDAVNAFYVYEAYIDVAAFEEHQRNEPFKEWESRIKPLMKSFNELFKGDSL